MGVDTENNQLNVKKGWIIIQSDPGQGRLNIFSQRAKHKVMEDTGHLMKIEVAFVERFEKPSKRIMFLLITKMKGSNSSTSCSSSDKDCAELEFSLEVFCVCVHVCLHGVWGWGQSTVKVSLSFNSIEWLCISLGCIKAYHVVCSFVWMCTSCVKSIYDFLCLMLVRFPQNVLYVSTRLHVGLCLLVDAT